MASYAYSRDGGGFDQTRQTAAIGYDYPLSKRTDIYAAYMYDHISSSRAATRTASACAPSSRRLEAAAAALTACSQRLRATDACSLISKARLLRKAGFVASAPLYSSAAKFCRPVFDKPGKMTSIDS